MDEWMEGWIDRRLASKQADGPGADRTASKIRHILVYRMVVTVQPPILATARTTNETGNKRSTQQIGNRVNGAASGCMLSISLVYDRISRVNRASMVIGIIISLPRLRTHMKLRIDLRASQERLMHGVIDRDRTLPPR